MNLQQSTHSLRTLRFGACHFLLNIALIAMGLGFLISGMITQNDQWLRMGATMFGFWIVSCYAFL